MFLVARPALAGPRIAPVCTPDMTFYPIVSSLLGILLGPTHAASLRAINALVWALLMCQSLHVADLGRAVPDLKAAGARQSMRRVRRVLDRHPLMSAHLTPFLIRVALRLVGDNPIILALDSTRCLRWEIFTIGVVFHGRVLPVAWRILPYPWPKKQFTPTVVALLEGTLFYWPTSRPAHLVADRGFPSLKLFDCLEHWRQRLPLGYTIRLRAGDWVHLADGRDLRLADLLKLASISSAGEGWTSYPASYRRRGKHGLSALLVVGHGQPEYPIHQRGPADQARRVARAKRRLAHLASKAQSGAADTDGVWILLTTCQTIEEARDFYELRFHTEGMYRDLKSWGLEAVAAHETDQRHLDGLMGLAVLGYFIQTAIGAVAGCATSTSAQARQRQRQWCTTDRLSVFWRGRQVLHDRAFDWRPWLKECLGEITHQLTPEPISTHQAHSPSPIPTNPTNKEAA